MRRNMTTLLGLAIIVAITSLSGPAVARTSTDAPLTGPPALRLANPAYCLATHDIGNMSFGVNNNGTIGTQYSSSGGQDCFSGIRVPDFAYPKGSNTQYLFGAAFWIGAVIGRDTLVSVGQDGWRAGVAEFHPDDPPLGNMIYRSTIDPSRPEYDGAISEQDYIAVYTDTFTTGVPGLANDVIDNRPHTPLHIEVTQRSFAWSYSYAEDFVLFDYAIKNIGVDRLRGAFLGVYVDADVHAVANQGNGAQDDICGFLHAIDAAYLPEQCPDSDIVNLAWIADADGDFLLPPGWEVPHLTGVRIVRAPSDSLIVSFNWWIGNTDPTYDFGPQQRAKLRDYTTGGTGTPEGDRNKYYVLGNGEFDYDQVFTASISPLDTLWMPPNSNVADDLSDGFDTRYLLSFGPFDIDPGQTLPLSFAYVGGKNFHTDEENINNLPDNPSTYYENVDFSDLGLNATWAEWLYDNPGVDTDDDGYAGEFDTCVLGGDSTLVRIDTIIDTLAANMYDTIIDTVWLYDNYVVIPRKGDGVPDFRGANPPPAPNIWVEPHVGSVTVRWNGKRSETTPDNFSQEIDFEGYRVHYARDERSSSFMVLSSFDFENYNKWTWDDSVLVDGQLGGFVLRESPFRLDELRRLYAPGGESDTLWHPLDYRRHSPLVFSGGPVDSIFYFEPQDFNRSVLANEDNPTTDIRKRYPNAMKPEADWIGDYSLIPDSLWDSLFTEDDYFKYYEYEYTIENLLPTVPYWINVTAFDYGSPQSGLPSLETSPTILPAVTYALQSTDAVLEDAELDVYIYPNPYRRDAGYRTSGFEGRQGEERERPDDRVRRVHFTNLPPECTIRIYSLDGDLIREIEHDVDPSDPLSNHDSWDLITRNTQLVVSGLYYWTVEAPDGNTQVGKLVIIM